MTEAGDPLGWVGCTIDGRVAIREVVGEGGFGIVYRGTHLGFDVPVAVKCLKVPAALTDDERSSFLKDFRDEARLLHQLSRRTTGIVQALDVGAAASPRGIWTPYMVMEWLEGSSLEDDIARRIAAGRPKRTLEEALELLSPVAESLAVSHAERVAHLDVKPANVFLATDGTTKLLDFGIAKVLTTSETLTRAFTRTGSMPAFTPAYAAPEQFNRRHGATGPWTDVFALALILIEVCSGEHALVGDTPLQLYVAAANEQYRPSLAAHGVRTNGDVDRVVKRALEVEPTQRFQDAGSLWMSLRLAIGAPLPPPRLPTATLEERQSLAPDGSHLPLSVAPTTHARGEVPTGMNRVCTVLFAELSGAMDAGELLDAEQVSQLVDRAMAVVSGCVEALGGTIERLVADSMMAVFGLYGDSTSAAERAVHAALRMASALKGLTLPRRLASQLSLGVRVGISTGRVFVSARQGTAGFQLAVTGAPVKLAARLQQSAALPSTMVDRDTYRHVAGLFEMELVERPRDQIASTASKAYLVKAPARDRHALPTSSLRDFCGVSTEFVGRTAEMATLSSTIESVLTEGHATLVTLLGPPGAGRTRMLAELADRLEQDDWAVLATSCSALHQQTSYALAASLLRARFHIHEDDSAEVAAVKLRRGLRVLRGADAVEDASPVASRNAPISRGEPVSLGLAAITGAALGELVDVDDMVAQLLRVLGVSEIDQAATLTSDDQSSAPKHRIAGAVAAMLRSAQGPVAILCDDLQWADEASLALLEDLCLRLSDTPLVILCTARPELLERRPLWGEGESFHQRVAVGPLPRRALEQMTRGRLRKVGELEPELVRRLVDHADGSPLTLVETLHLLVDMAVIDSASEPWKVHSERLGELALPTTVHGIVQARLDRLDERSRMLLAHAAVVGRTFWDGVLLELDPEGRSEGVTVRWLLAELRERGLIHARRSSTFPDEQEYVFSDAATQRVAYEMLGHKERRQIHASVARWLESRLPSDAGAALTASHHERAAALSAALDAWRRGGAHAASLGQTAEALHCYERACRIEDWMCGESATGETLSELLVAWEDPDSSRAPDWTDRVGLRTEIGDVLRRAGRFDEAVERYRQARHRLGQGEEARVWEARLDYREAAVEKLRGNVEAALAHLERALAHDALAARKEEYAELWALMATLHHRRGRSADCYAACRRGIRVCRSASRRSDRWRQAVSRLLNALGSMFFTEGRLIVAERCYLQAARVVDERRNPDQASQALNNVAAARYARGELAGARECFQHVLRLTERSGDPWVKMTALGNLGEVELALERPANARTCLEEAVVLGERIRAHLDLPEFYRHLARAELADKAPAAALAAASRALELVGSSGGRMYLAGVVDAAAEVSAAVMADQAAVTLHGLARELGDRLLAMLDAEPVPEEVASACRLRLAASRD